MQVAYDVLRLLKDGKFHSGTSLALELKVSRSSIWKGIQFLRQLEVAIQAVPGRGYRWYQPCELLSQNEILSALTPAAKQALGRIDVVNVIASTNDYLIQRFPHGIPNGTVCVAEAQTQGRGRMGKIWRSPFGANIYVSLYWRFYSRLHELSGLSLTLGLAIISALKVIAPLPSGVGIKWPNDIWHGQQKLCGILVESFGQHGQATSPYTDVVIGVGMNLCMPEKMQITTDWTDLQRVFGFTPSRNKLIGQILSALVDNLIVFQAQGFSPFTAEWPDYDLLLNQCVVLTTPHMQESGIAQGVNDRGELYVKVGDKLKAVRYGDVSVKPNTHK